MRIVVLHREREHFYRIRCNENSKIIFITTKQKNQLQSARSHSVKNNFAVVADENCWNIKCYDTGCVRPRNWFFFSSSSSVAFLWPLRDKTKTKFFCVVVFLSLKTNWLSRCRIDLQIEICFWNKTKNYNKNTEYLMSKSWPRFL